MNKKDLIILKGTFLHTPSAASFTCHKEHYLVARQGRIVSLTPELPEKYAGAPIAEEARGSPPCRTATRLCRHGVR